MFLFCSYGVKRAGSSLQRLRAINLTVPDSRTQSVRLYVSTTKTMGIGRENSSFVAVVALVISFSMGAEAQTSATGVTKSAVSTKQPKKASYGKGMRAPSGAGRKMSGSC